MIVKIYLKKRNKIQQNLKIQNKTNQMIKIT
jgi:hypothetical protein